MRKLTTDKGSLARRGVLLLLFSALLIPTASWALTAANTLIRNQASATFKDETGISYSVTSNVVETLVQQVAGLELTQDQTKLGNADNAVEFPHVVTNTGNGDDSYHLTPAEVAGDDFDFVSITFYPDANQDGQADDLNSPITQTPNLKAGESFAFVAIAKLPDASLAANGSTGKLTITAASAFEATTTVLNTDTVKVTDQAIIDVKKSMSATLGASGSGPYTVTLSYRNTSAIDATQLMLIDKLPSGMTYVPNSARWSGTGTQTLTDANIDQQTDVATGSTISYCAYDSSCVGLPDSNLDADTDSTNQVLAGITSINAGIAGQLSFNVMIDPNLPASFLSNLAEYALTDLNEHYYTNPVKFEVTPHYQVVANGSSSSSVNGTSEPIIINTSVQGSSVTFYDYVWNNGNTTDSFDLSLLGSTFPNNNFQLLQADGFTPILDTNGNGLPDTGLLAPGEYYIVAIKTVLPASLVGNNSNNGYQVSLKASSIQDSSVTDTALNTLTTITAKAVDITNDEALGSSGAEPGKGIGPEAAPVTTNSAMPGTTSAFSLYVNNTSSSADNFNLQVSTDSSFNTITLPANWAVTFSSAADNDLKNTGSIMPNTAKAITATVSIPANAAPQTVQLYFRAISPNTGVYDIKHDAVAVSAVTDIVLYPDNRGQVLPGGVIIYTHWLTNQGNDTKTNITFQHSDDKADWTSVLYADTNGDGLLSAGDAFLSTVPSLAVDESILIFNKVNAAATIPMGQTNTTTIKALWDAGASTTQVIDVTTTNNSDVTILKEQVLDSDCNGVPNSGASFSADSFPAAPNQCVIYRLTATNTGAEQVQNVKIQDAAPAYTSFNTAGGLPLMSQGSLAQAISQGGTGIIIGNVGSLAAGDTATLTFGVRIH